MNRLFQAFTLASILCFSVAPVARAQTIDAASEVAEMYLRGFVMNNEAVRLEAAGDFTMAQAKFKQASEIMDSIARNHPEWQAEMRASRQAKIQDSLTRVQMRLTQKATADAGAPAPAPAAATATATTSPYYAPERTPAGSAVPMPGLVMPATLGALPSLGDMLSQWEGLYKKKLQDLESQVNQQQTDLGKWQNWYQWASGEITTARAQNEALGQKAAAMEQSILTMTKDAEEGRASQGQLAKLMEEKMAVELEVRKNAQRLAAAEGAAKEASEKLAESAARVATVEQERDKILKERDDVIKQRDVASKERDGAVKDREGAVKERDAASARSLGLQTELEDLKKKGGSIEMKRLIAENERLKKELTEATKQVETLKGDVTRKDQEIAQLRGQLTGLQGELATLRQQSGAYQTQVAELTRQLKEMPAATDAKTAATTTPELAQENEMLRAIIMRQLRTQHRQQSAKDLMIAELQKMENSSNDLIKQVEELKSARMTLTPDEEKLFTDPAVRELISSTGVQVTLIANASPASDQKAAPPPPSSAEALITKANDTYMKRDFEASAKLYQDALRAEPKNVSALIGLGMARQRADKNAEAEVSLQKALAYDPENEPAAFALGVTYYKQERWKDAMTYFEKSLAKRPDNATGRHYLGIIATKLSLLERAEREFKTALAIDPAYGEAHFNLSVLYITWDPPQWDKARSEYEAALKKGVKADANLEKLLQGAKVSQR